MHQDFLATARQKLSAEAFTRERLADTDPASTAVVFGLPMKAHPDATQCIAVHRPAAAWRGFTFGANDQGCLRPMSGRAWIQALACAVHEGRAPTLGVQHCLIWIF